MSIANNSVRIQAERFADNIIGETDSSFPGLSGIKERLVANATKSLEEMAMELVKKGFPDIRVDETNCAVIAAKVNAEPSATVGEIFQAALNHHRKESAAKTKRIVEEHVERLSKQINVVEAFLERGDWYIELAKRNIGDSRIYWRFLNKMCEKVTQVVADTVAVAVFQDVC